MKKALLVLGIMFLFSSIGIAGTYNLVTNCSSDASTFQSLPYAIVQANSNGWPIQFNITTAEARYSTGEAYPGLVTTEATGKSWFRIILNSTQTISNNNVWIKGSTQPTTESNNPSGPEVEIRMIGDANIFYLTGSGVTIEGLAINRTGGSNLGTAIALNNNLNCCILGCYIGVSATGEVVSPTRNEYGINLYGSASNHLIGNGTAAGRNIISGNATGGIYFNGSSCVSNQILGNYIGTNAGGTAAIGNGYGVWLASTATSNKIGDGTAGGKNVISGNSSYGIFIFGSAACSNEVLGNYIGTTATGEAALPNGDRAIHIESDAMYNQIGNGTDGGRNIISGNSAHGVHIYSATYNEVKGNYIGLTPSGAKLGNAWDGVYLETNADHNRIGGTNAGDKNVISGNGGIGNSQGIVIHESNYNEILGNYIGTNIGGTSAIGNSNGGIKIQSGGSLTAAMNNMIGNGAATGRNIISGNGGSGIFLTVNGNYIRGNYIGTKADGLSALANAAAGVEVSGARFTVIGGAGQGNVISGNGTDGIYIYTSGANSNEVSGNYIGTNASGEARIDNVNNGIYIKDCGYNKIGGTQAGTGNLISGNTWRGILLDNSSTNEIYGNIIGLEHSGTSTLYNGFSGIIMQYSSNYNKIGNGTANGRNVISKNNDGGIVINSSCSNEVLGNYVGTKADGTGNMGNSSHGIFVRASGSPSSRYNKIGDGTAGGRNIICGSTGNGIILQEDAVSNEVNGNYIGVEADGLTACGNNLNGIYLYGGDLYYDNVASNVIANNGNGDPAYHGVLVRNTTAKYDKISRNSIYANSGKGIKLLSGGNQEVASPEITSVKLNDAIGQAQIAGLATAEANGTIEIFKSQGSQGKTYLGSTTADGSGNWNAVVTGLASGDAVVATGTSLNFNTSEFSASKEVIVSVFKAYQPDLAVDISSAGTDYRTIGVYENTPSTQVQTMSVATNEAAVFYIKFLNAGNTGDTLLVSGEGSNGDFTVTYLEGKTGTSEITIPYSANMASGESGEGRVQITYTGNTIATKEIVVTATTTNDGTKKDAIKAIATFVPLPSPTPPIPTEHATQEFTETQLGVTGMHITIPSGATTVDVTVTAAVITAPSAPPAGYSVGGQSFNIGSTPVNTFSVPVTVTIPITGPLTFPKVYYWDGTKWSTEGIMVISHTATSLTFTTLHFTIFAPMATLPSNLVRFGPNPYNPNNGSGKFWYVLSADADTTIYLIDLAGTVQFKQTYPAGTNGGKNGENNIAYDGKTAWGDTLGQGVYVYKIVQGGKAIGGGKIAVIK